MTLETTQLIPPLVTQRKITGMSAILLPFTPHGEIDWEGFEAHVSRTLDAGLAPAVNMDTGYGNQIDDSIRFEVLKRTQKLAGDRRYVAGAFVADEPGDAFHAEAYHHQIESILFHEGIPVIFQTYGLTQHGSEATVEAYRTIGTFTEQFIAFELGQMFAPFGAIYDIDTYREIMKIPQCIGAKHSSLSRQLEWDRLALRNETRKDFMVMTGNDLAIDMVQYGSDYLLGLSTFDPVAFAKRDAYWEAGDPAFYELNDLLQYLGFFAFRTPVPAYKHSAAQYLHLQGYIASNLTHPDSGERPASDIEILDDIRKRINALVSDS